MAEAITGAANYSMAQRFYNDLHGIVANYMGLSEPQIKRFDEIYESSPMRGLFFAIGQYFSSLESVVYVDAAHGNIAVYDDNFTVTRPHGSGHQGNSRFGAGSKTNKPIQPRPPQTSQLCEKKGPKK